MRQAHLAGTDLGPAADEPLDRDGVVRRADRAVHRDRASPVEQPCHRVDPAHLDRFGAGERGHQSQRGAQDQRLPDAGRPAQRDGMPPGHGDLHGTAGHRLTDDLLEVWQFGTRRLGNGRLARGHRQLRHPGHVRYRRAERRCRTHGDAAHHRGLDAVGRGHDRLPDPRPAGGIDQGDHARDRLELAVERQLPQERGVGPAQRELVRGHEDADRDGQVVRRALFLQVRRREVHRHASRRKLEAGVANCAPHPLPRLENGAAGKTDDRETGQAEGDIDLDRHEGAVHAKDGRAEASGQHGQLPAGGSQRKHEAVPAACLLASQLPAATGACHASWRRLSGR